MATLLVIDDEPNLLYSLRKSLQSDDLAVLTAETGQQGIELARSTQVDAVILDVRLPDMSGLTTFEALQALDPRLPVIFVTAFSTTETAIEAMRRGAFEYLLKPFDFHRLRTIIDQAIEVNRISHVPAVVDDQQPSDTPGDRIVGATPSMQEIYKLIGRVSPQDVTVLIQGESGTGKELVARAVYHYSRRNQRPFLAINCAAIPEPLLESELFGHERGAFTGADRRRIGKFEQLHGGTLFLDEIGDMTPATQSKILRVLQERCFERVGSNETIHTDVRVIAATNKNLEALVAAGAFRQDLYYRLNVFTLRLPPLRERKDDLALLAIHFIRQMSRELGKPAAVLTPEAMQVFLDYDWPGNVRELQSTIRYALVRSAGSVITADCIPEAIRAAASGQLIEEPLNQAQAQEAVGEMTNALLHQGSTDIYRQIHNQMDRYLFERVLSHVRGNQFEAAALLGISRTTLRAKLRALGMAVEKQVQSEENDPLELSGQTAEI